MTGPVILQWLAILASCALCYLYGRLRGSALAYREAQRLLTEALAENDPYNEFGDLMEELERRGE